MIFNLLIVARLGKFAITLSDILRITLRKIGQTSCGIIDSLNLPLLLVKLLINNARVRSGSAAGSVTALGIFDSG